MFDHVTIRVADRATSERFYRTVLAALGVAPVADDAGFLQFGDFSIIQADAAHPPTRNLHVAFVARSHDEVDAFWQAGLDAGFPDDGAPGPRPQYRDDYYGGFLRDPDGNSVEAVCHGDVRGGGHVDHLWIRVADLDASAGFYATLAPRLGLRHGGTEPGRRQFVGAWATFSLIADPGRVTTGMHVAFPAPDRAGVDAFHTAALAAGYADNGAPGPREQYSPGYYGAFVLAPDGANVESVHHGR